MLKMVDGTGIIGVDMVCPLGGAVSPPQPPNYDKVEMEGVGSLMLPNSLKAPLERLELIGNSTQLTTTGKNLANPSEFVVGTLAGDTGNIINLKQYFTTGYIPVIPGKRYSTSCGNKFLAHTIIAYDKEKTKINSPINMSSEMPEGAAYIRQVYRKIDMTNVTESDMEELKKVCMVNEGSTVLPYEPYTGGKPSPSPEYPQEIKNVGKWNEGTQKYEIVMQVKGADTELQSLTLTSDRPITKWDRLVEQGGEIGWLCAGVVIDRFDGQSNKISIANKQGDVQNFSIRFENVANGNGNSDIFVDKYRAVQLSYTKAEYGICCNWNDGVKYFSAPNENVATVDEFKGWLVENPLKIAYETTNLEFIPLPQSEQNAIRALKTYYPTTVITVDGGELDPDIKVTYRKEI